jgi:hypothetical protein
MFSAQKTSTGLAGSLLERAELYINPKVDKKSTISRQKNRLKKNHLGQSEKK